MQQLGEGGHLFTVIEGIDLENELDVHSGILCSNYSQGNDCPHGDVDGS